MSDRGIQRLANAVLLQAINDAVSRSAGRRANALQWMSREDESCYSFSFICRILNRDPEGVRRFCQRRLAERQAREMVFPEASTSPGRYPVQRV